ncbi:hypothetical protein Q044_02798, partial [Pseudomonas aeruginosa BWHPSA039]
MSPARRVMSAPLNSNPRSLSRAGAFNRRLP